MALREDLGFNPVPLVFGAALGAVPLDLRNTLAPGVTSEGRSFLLDGLAEDLKTGLIFSGGSFISSDN